MGKYHITKDGKIRPCNAKNRCPLGGLHVEANGIEEATQKVGIELAKQYPTLANQNKPKREKKRTGNAQPRKKMRQKSENNEEPKTTAEFLQKHNLPEEVLDYVGIDNDGTIVLELEQIENLLGENNTAYSDLMLYQELAELKNKEEELIKMIESNDVEDRKKAYKILESRNLAENQKNEFEQGLKENSKSGMKRDEILNNISMFAQSQGSYGRMLRDIKELEENDPEGYEDLMITFEEQKFNDPLDMVIYFET